MAQPELGGESVALVTVLNERGSVPAAVFVERRAAGYPILIGIGAEHQAVALIKGQVVLPVDRVAVGVEHVTVVAELVEGIVVVVTGKRRPGAVDACRFVEAGAEVEMRLFVATRQAKTVLAGVAVAEARVQPRLQTLLNAPAGENLDHAANRVGPVDDRARTAQHLHAFDLLDIQKLQRAVAGGG
nr:hypothetical protein [Tanacetum cinerariifolium]